MLDPTGLIALPGGPLQLHERGVWDPAAQYWGEPEDTIAQVIAGGPRLGFEFEQILPSHGDPDSDEAIIGAMGLRDRGDAAAAIALLSGLLERDARCLDAHAHLGLLAFNGGDTQLALGHHATGIQIAERSLPELFNGVLPWGWIDKPPVPALPARPCGERLASRRARPRGNLCWALCG